MAAPPFFIVGSARSGTTLLRMMLNAHPRVAVPPESRFITELHRGDEVDAGRFLAELAGHRQFSNWDLPIEEVAALLPESGTIPYAEAASAPHRAYAARSGREVWGDKTPRYIEHLGLLSRLWPEARIVHLVRDGRNVALSYADVPFGPKTVAGAARLWAERVQHGMEAASSLGDRYLELRYEDFVGDPRTGAERLASFLGIGYDDGMLDYTERSKGHVLARAARYNPHVTERPQQATRSWETDMSPSQVEVFEAVAGDVLTTAGYKRRYPKPSASARLKALLGRTGLPIGRLKGRSTGQE